MASITSPDDLLICVTCGTQFNTSDRSALTSCHICDDPRQYVPASGQSFTTLAALRGPSNTPPPYENQHQAFATDPRFISLWTEPKAFIGQRAILIRTPTGNVLWDCIAALDAALTAYIEDLGGLRAIVISHPHYYTTHLEWARVFGCPVYLARDDAAWLARPDPAGCRRFLDLDADADHATDGWDVEGTGVRVLRLGGHFPGSLVALYDGRLLVADTLVMTPGGVGDWGERGRPKGMSSFAFMWSIPNMIPLGPEEMARMWRILKKYDFRSVHGAFNGMDLVADDAKARVLESMQIQVRNEEHVHHPLLRETVPG